MNIIKEAGHPIYTGAVPLAKGKLMNEGKTEHFEKNYHNETLLIETIYHSNMLTAILALWKHVPHMRQMASPAEPKEFSSKAAGATPCVLLMLAANQREVENEPRATVAKSRPLLQKLRLARKGGAQKKKKRWSKLKEESASEKGISKLTRKPCRRVFTTCCIGRSCIK